MQKKKSENIKKSDLKNRYEKSEKSKMNKAINPYRLSGNNFSLLSLNDKTPNKNQNNSVGAKR